VLAAAGAGLLFRACFRAAAALEFRGGGATDWIWLSMDEADDRRRVDFAVLDLELRLGL
jgi:hypothetical protein